MEGRPEATVNARRHDNRACVRACVRAGRLAPNMYTTSDRGSDTMATMLVVLQYCSRALYLYLVL